MLTTRPRAPELVFLALPVTLAQLAAFAVKDGPTKAVSALASIELANCASAFASMRPNSAMACASRVGRSCNLQRSHNAGRRYSTKLERTGQPQHVVPVRHDAPPGKPLPGDYAVYPPACSVAPSV